MSRTKKTAPMRPVVRWLTVVEVAAKLKIDRTTIYKWFREGRDFPEPSYALGGPRWLDTVIDEFMAADVAGGTLPDPAPEVGVQDGVQSGVQR